MTRATRLYRYYGHFEGDAMTYRAPGEAHKMREERDALKSFRRRVVAAGLIEDKDLEAVDHEVARRIDEAVAAAEAAGPPKETDLKTDVYVNY